MEWGEVEETAVELLALLAPSGEEMSVLTGGAAAALAEPTIVGELGLAVGAAAYFATTRGYRLLRYAFRAKRPIPRRTVELRRLPDPDGSHAMRIQQYSGQLGDDGYQLVRRGMMPVRLKIAEASRMLDLMRDAGHFHVQAALDARTGRLRPGQLWGRKNSDSIPGPLTAGADDIQATLQAFADQFIEMVRKELPDLARTRKPTAVLAKRFDPGYRGGFVHIDKDMFVVSAGYTRNLPGTPGGTLSRAPSTVVSHRGPVSKQPPLTPDGSFHPQPDRVVSVMNGNVPHHSPGVSQADTVDRLFIAVVYE